ncbi:MAG TPA: DUF3298 and DUF4163 domain-containing protein [Pyrinomonadaceae bacterium]|jgi:hypothetical protein
MKNKIILLALVFSAFSIQIYAQNKAKIFRGEIADKTVQLTLTRTGDKISGTYYYQKVGKDLKLAGSINSEGDFRLDEFAPNGAKTGEIKGKWKESVDDNGAQLEGEWMNPKTKENLSFYATEQIIDFSSPAKLISRVFNEQNKLKMYEITAQYPELSGVNPAFAAEFNKLVKDSAMKEINSFKGDMLALTAEDLKFAKERGVSNYLEMNYAVELADDNTISIAFANSVYEGGAHPNHFSFTINYDLKNGREIKLGDLFKSNSGYLKAISDYCIKKLKEDAGEMTDEEWLKTGAGADAKNFKSWNLTRKGILINFDPYQVAPYTAGPQDVLIPFDKLKNILRAEYSRQ